MMYRIVVHLQSAQCGLPGDAPAGEKRACNLSQRITYREGDAGDTVNFAHTVFDEQSLTTLKCILLILCYEVKRFFLLAANSL
jgi:hypothetical protein